jgi:hypothetical protein
VKGRIIYRAKTEEEADLDQVTMLFRFKNAKKDGVGEPLPSGKVALFQEAAGQRMLVGQSQIADKAVDEDVDFILGGGANVTASSEELKSGSHWNTARLTVRNANPFAVRFEAEFNAGPGKNFGNFSRTVEKRPGKQVWAADVPANGTATLDYRITEVE